MRKRKLGQAHGEIGTPSPMLGANGDENHYGVVSGLQPDSREGHTCDVTSDGFMLVFGGDRHHMPFNDLHLIQLNDNWLSIPNYPFIIGITILKYKNDSDNLFLVWL